MQNLWLSPAQLEQEYGIKQSQQAKMRMSSHGSKIPFSKVGRQVMYNREQIEAWLESLRVQ